MYRKCLGQETIEYVDWALVNAAEKAHLNLA